MLPWPESASSLVWRFFLSEVERWKLWKALSCFLDYLTDTKRKRHMVGGILMSVSLFFGGLAFTMMTIKGDIDNEQDRA